MNRVRLMGMIGVCIALFADRGTGQTESPSAASPDAAPLVVTNVPPPATRLESMQSQKGTVIVRGYSEIGSVQGEDGSAIRVTALELTDVSRPAKEYGLVIDVHQTRGGDRIATSYVDYDEIDTLLTAIDYLGKLDNAITQMAAFEAAFRTKGDLNVGNFSSNGARIIAFRGIQIAPVTGLVAQATAYFQLGRIPELRQMIVAGKETIDRIKSKS